MEVCYTKTTPLRWNKFPITHSVSDVSLEFWIKLTTKILSLNLISDERVQKHNLIIQLHNNGLDDESIARYLNEKGIKTPRGLDYYRELVFVTRRKLMLREKRKTSTEYKLGKLGFVIKEK